ncbi:hypothetical protein QQF64_006410 [Cirrhinus molitorella]|uniref:Uncharacterized protein n=1 Tax=Cirrhinus molitorella TaxID=172907 RepID=A0ABR3MH58_9TELE
MEGLRERSRKNVLGVWNLGAGGCRGDVIGAEELEKNNSLSLFRSSLQSQQGREGGREGEEGREGVLAGSRGRGCWEMVKDAKQALQPTLVAHIFVL